MNVRTMTLAVVASLAAAGCGGGGGNGGGGGAELTAGSYTAGNVTENSNTCSPLSPAGLEGQTVDVTVDGADVTIGGQPYTLNGNDLSSSVSGQVQIVTDCTVDISVTDTGSVTANDEAHINEVANLSNPVGAACAGLGITFPCSMDYEFDLTK